MHMKILFSFKQNEAMTFTEIIAGTGKDCIKQGELVSERHKPSLVPHKLERNRNGWGPRGKEGEKNREEKKQPKQIFEKF